MNPGTNPGREVVFDLDAAAFSSDEFRMYQFKVKRCPRSRPHDWTQCPFAHPGEKAKRRCPERYRYSGTACPEFRRNGCCRRQDACPFAHGVFECWLHPSRYRTQLCTDGVGCKRRVCFFAHAESELRKPEEDPVWLQQQMQAELAAEQQAQQSEALRMFSALLGQQGDRQQASGAGEAAADQPRAAAVDTNSLEAALKLLLGHAAVTCDQAAAAQPVQPPVASQPAPSAASSQGNPLQLLQQLLQQAVPVATNSTSSDPAAAMVQLLNKAQQQQQPAAMTAALPVVSAATTSTPAAAQLLALLSSDASSSTTGGTAPDIQGKVLQLLQQQQQQQQQQQAAPSPQVDVNALASQLMEAMLQGGCNPAGASLPLQPAATSTAALAVQLQQLALAQSDAVPASSTPSPAPTAAPLAPADAVAQVLLAATASNTQSTNTTDAKSSVAISEQTVDHKAAPGADVQPAALATLLANIAASSTAAAAPSLQVESQTQASASATAALHALLSLVTGNSTEPGLASGVSAPIVSASPASGDAIAALQLVTE